MPYSQYKLKDITSKLGLTVSKQDIWEGNTPVQILPSDWLKMTLEISLHQPLSSEKARSELIVSPILLEITRRNNFQVSLLSGVNLEIDASLGLNGECDFILAGKPNIIDIERPILAIIEAKDNDIKQGIPQCISQMYGALQYNSQEKDLTNLMWGCVTTGTEWQFLKLKDNAISVHNQLLYLNQVPEVLGYLQAMI